MQISEQIPDSDATFLRRGEGELAVVFVHGFLDDQHVWDKVIDELKTPGVLRTGHRLRLRRRMPRIYDGPSEVHRWSIARRVVAEVVKAGL